MLNSSENFTVLLIMILYGSISGGSAIILKKGIFKAGGIKIDKFFRDILPTAWCLLTTPTWLIGGILALIGFLIYTYALNSYDVSVVKPLVNFNLMFTFIFSYFIFKEKLIKIEWFGIIILISGLLLAAFSPQVESSNEMNLLILYIMFPFSLILALIMIYVMFISRGKKAEEFVFPIFAGIFFGIGTFFTKSLLLSLNLLNFMMLVYSFFMLIFTYAFATISQQLAFERGRLSIVSPVTNALSVSVSFIGAYFIFFEELIPLINGKLVFHSFFKILGLICILSALFILRREIKPYSRHSISNLQ